MITNNYDKYGRTTNIKVESIISINTGEPIDQDFRIVGSMRDLTNRSKYVLHMRGNQFIASDDQTNAGLSIREQLAYNTNINTANYSNTFDRENRIIDAEPENVGRSFRTSKRGDAFSIIKNSVEGRTHDYKEGERNFRNTRPITQPGHDFSDFVSGTVSSGAGIVAARGGGLSATTGTVMMKSINDFVKTFKANTGSNVAFVEQITINLNNIAQLAGWNQVATQLRTTYNPTVRIIIDAAIEQKNQGLSAPSNSGTYGEVKYNVSGVSDGDKTKAASGNL